MSNLVTYRPEIDGLRALAVLAVIFYHINPILMPGGYIGVDIFFVISGYLITSIIHGELISGKFTFINFYERRARRLLPALFVVLFLSTGLGYILLTPGEFQDYGQSLVSVNLFLSNIFFFLKSGYFDVASERLPLLHTWSLAVEEQFYIFFPILLVAIKKFFKAFNNINFLYLFFAIIVFSFLYMQWNNANEYYDLNFYNSFARAWELLLGSVIAIIFSGYSYNINAFSNVIKNFLSVFGLTAVILSFIFFDHSITHPGPLTLIPVLGVALIIINTNNQSIVNKLLSLKPVVKIGLISYSAYLIHLPLIVYYRIIFGNIHNILVEIIFLVLTLYLAYLSWKYIESPFRNKSIYPRKKIFLGSTIFVSAFIFFGLFLHFSNGMPGRYSESKNEMLAMIEISPMRAKCHTEGVNYLQPMESCRYNELDYQSWAILGDSHGVEIGYSLAKLLSERNQGGLLHLTKSGCPPIYTFNSNVPGCSSWLKESLEFLTHDQDIKNIVLVWRHALYLHGDLVKTYPKLPNVKPGFLTELPEELSRNSYMKDFISMINSLKLAGKNVLILDPIPELPRHIEVNIFSRWVHDSVKNQGLSYDMYLNRNSYYLNFMEENFIEDNNILIINTASPFCKDRCFSFDSQNRPLYFDDNHLNLLGSDHLIKFIDESIDLTPKYIQPKN